MIKNAARKECLLFSLCFILYFFYFFLCTRVSAVVLFFVVVVASCVRMIVEGHLPLEFLCVRMRVCVYMCVRIALSGLHASDYLFTHL